MHLSNLFLLPLALLPLVTAQSGEGGWSLRGTTDKDAKPDNPDSFEELASGSNTAVCEDLSNGQAVQWVKGTTGDFSVTVYEGEKDSDGKKCMGEGAAIQPGKVYEGPFKHYEVFLFLLLLFFLSFAFFSFSLFSPLTSHSPELFWMNGSLVMIIGEVYSVKEAK